MECLNTGYSIRAQVPELLRNAQIS